MFRGFCQSHFLMSEVGLVRRVVLNQAGSFTLESSTHQKSTRRTEARRESPLDRKRARSFLGSHRLKAHIKTRIHRHSTNCQRRASPDGSPIGACCVEEIVVIPSSSYRAWPMGMLELARRKPPCIIRALLVRNSTSVLTGPAWVRYPALRRFQMRRWWEHKMNSRRQIQPC